MELYYNGLSLEKRVVMYLIRFALFLLFIINTLVLAEIEPNNSIAQAESWATLNAGQSSSLMSGSVSNGNDDYYKIVINNPGSLSITGTASANTNFYLYNSSGSIIESRTNTRAPSIISNITSTGTYYLRISRSGNSNYSNMQAALERPFALRDSRNIRGDVTVIGNTVLCVHNNFGQCYDYTGNSANSQLDLRYIDVDGVNRTYNNSSQALLSIPSTAVVKWAGIYTQGYLNGVNLASANSILNDPVYVTVPNTGTIASIPTVIDILPNETDGYTYDTFAPLTTLIGKTGAQINGWITGANIKAYTGTDSSGLGNYGAWSLVVIYDYPGTTLKNISVFDGYRKISSAGNSSVDVSVGGFKTPLTGSVSSNLSLFVGEGDAGINGDRLYLNGTAINNSNAFYSTLMGVSANPSFSNNQGIDIQTHQVGIDGNTSHQQIIGTNQSSATITFTTTGDTYFPSLAIFSTEIYSPTIGNFDKNVAISYASNQICGEEKDLRGATLNYEMSFENTGTEAASTVRVYDDFQSNGILSYLDMTQTTVPTVQLISGTAASTITCDKNATAVYCDFNRINIGTKYKINFSTKVKNTIVLSDDINLSNTANAHYYNASTGDEITQIASSNMQIAGGICAVLPLANYRFDECLWNGTANEILDYSGNTYHASIFNTGAFTEDRSISGGGICRTSKLGGNAYLQLSTSFPNLTSDFSITGWFNSSNITRQGQRIFIDDQSNSSGYGLSVNDDGNRYVRFYDRSQSGNGIIDATAAPLSTNQWYFAAAVTDVTQSTRHLYVYDNTGVLLDHKTMAISGAVGTDSGPASMGGETNSGETANRFQGYQDEIKVFAQALTDTQITQIALNEANQLNYDGRSRTCNTCSITPDPDNFFDAWDSFRSISDRNISTKIVNKPFTLTVASLDETNTAYRDFNGTVCARLIDTAGTALTEWTKLIYASEQTKTATFVVDRAIGGFDNARIRLMWEKDAPIATACDALTDTNTSIASDRFALRPASFALPSASGISGVDFNITFTAPNFSGTASADFNETAGGSFDVSIAEHNPLCTVGTFTPTPSSFSFVNGIKIFTTRYSEVGVLDVNITDRTKVCAAKYANVDCDDADVAGFYSSTSDLPIGLTQAQITIKPHHFDVTGTLTNFAGGNFTYLSDDLNMSAALDLNITAKNGEGNTTANYSSACYAKNTDLTLVHSSVPSPLTKILYSESLTAVNTNVLKGDPWTLSLNSGLFNSGSVAPNIDFNFDRSPSNPLNPFDFNITSATATDADAVTGSGIPLGDSTFVYGRARAYDVTTNEAFAPNPIEFEIYSTTPNVFVSGMPQNVLKWYRNLDHDTAAEGNVIRGGFSAGVTDSAIDTSATPSDGLQIVTVTSVHDQTIHLDISPWLWYSPNYTYDYNGNCTRHPCFNYDYTDAAGGVKGVNSGTFQGSDFQMTPAQNITNKGVKLFR